MPCSGQEIWEIMTMVQDPGQLLVISSAVGVDAKCPIR